jgi:hypothetical protein
MERVYEIIDKRLKDTYKFYDEQKEEKDAKDLLEWIKGYQDALYYVKKQLQNVEKENE